MKKFLIIILLFLTLLTACGKRKASESGSEIEIESVRNAKVISSFSTISNSDTKKYEIADSFKMVDGNYYYLFYIGIIEAAPISVTDSGVYYQGGETTLSFALKQGTSEQVSKTVKNATSNSVSLKSKVSVSAEVGNSYAKVKAGIENECTHSLTETFESSITKACTQSQDFTQTVSYKFENDQAIGYYCYASLASIKIYEAVVYSPKSGSIISASPYSLVGHCFPGLIYSRTSFFDYEAEKIEFDLSKINDFPEPINSVDTKVTISLDANGGTVDGFSREYTIGESFGSIPTPNWKGHNFGGWYQDNERVDENSIVMSDSDLIAHWTAVVTTTYNVNGAFTSQNAFGTSEEMDTAKCTIQLSDCFDIGYLKEKGFTVRFTITYTADFVTTSIGSLKYKIYVTNGSSTVYQYEDTFSSKCNRTLTSNAISSYDGTMFIKLYTANIQGVILTNMKVKVDFIGKE